MTEATSREVFNLLYESLRANGFIVVGTELLQVSDSDQTNPVYPDTLVAFQDLYDRAQTLNESQRCLRDLISATRSYFLRTQGLLPHYRTNLLRIHDFPGLGESPLIIQNGEDPKSMTNVNSVLSNARITEMLTTLSIMSEYIESDDETFFQRINEVI
jgi:hypothetical protein